MAVNINESGSLKTLGGLQVAWDIYRKNDEYPGCKVLTFTTTAGSQWAYHTITFEFSPTMLILFPTAGLGGDYAYGHMKLTQTNNSFEEVVSADSSASDCGSTLTDGSANAMKFTLSGSDFTIGIRSRSNATSTYKTNLTCHMIAIG